MSHVVAAAEQHLTETRRPLLQLHNNTLYKHVTRSYSRRRVSTRNTLHVVKAAGHVKQKHVTRPS